MECGNGNFQGKWLKVYESMCPPSFSLPSPKSAQCYGTRWNLSISNNSWFLFWIQGTMKEPSSAVLNFPFWSVVLSLIKWDVVSSLEPLRKVLVGWKNTRGGLQNRNDLAKCIELSNSALKATGCPYSLVLLLVSGLRGICKGSVNSACALVVGNVHIQTKQHNSTNCLLEVLKKESNALLNETHGDKNILNVA